MKNYTHEELRKMSKEELDALQAQIREKIAFSERSVEDAILRLKLTRFDVEGIVDIDQVAI